MPVLKDPSPARQTHWTGVALHGFLKQELAIELGCRTVIRRLQELDVNLRVPRPWPESQDEEKKREFLRNLEVLASESQGLKSIS